MADVLKLWGKTSENGDFHPAVFHMLDAGHVAAQFLGAHCPPRITSVLARVLGERHPSNLAAWLPLVVALHDLGKISSPFQKQVPEQRERLEALGVSFPVSGMSKPVRHQHVSAMALRFETIPTLLSPLARHEQLIVDLIGGHHGEYALSRELKSARILISQIEGHEWQTLRQEAVALLLRAFPSPTALQPAESSNLRAATVALTGFVILCDWLASDSDIFPPAPNMPFDEYVPISQRLAAHAVTITGFRDTRRPVNWSGFDAAFPEIQHPRPLQRAIDELPVADRFEPGLFVIEAPTGEGKTEAALALARRLAVSGSSDELYVALPTMATSNQMYGRVMKYLEHNSGSATAVKLIHGQAFLVKHDLQLAIAGDTFDPESPAASAPAWFAPRKRSLLAPFGVGTVDQAELAVLNARHYMLRLFGLAGKVVIIDEVHAYDSYMSTIIDHALTWLAALGSPVILLSATLPASRHQEMATAYRRGLTDAAPSSQHSSRGPLPYPVIAVYTSGGQDVRSPAASQPERSLQLWMVPERSDEEEARYLLETVAEGGAVCRITNTVNRAQNIFQALSEIAPESVERYLLHARLPLDDRLAREAAAGARLGPDSGRTRHDRLIVIGTQVLEQSLDYDVDRMITDLAPIDLLLQRAGRLHRHSQRASIRPDKLRHPVLEVVTGKLVQRLPTLGASEFVYEPLILLKSWLTLERRASAAGIIELTLPSDYRPLIEETYDGRFDVLPVDHPGFERFGKAVREWKQTRQKMLDSAKERLVPDVHVELPITEGATLRFEEDEDGGGKGWGSAATRYGERSITIIPLHRVPGGVAIEPNGSPIGKSIAYRPTQLRLLRRGIRVGNQYLVNHLPGMFDADLAGWSTAPLLRHQHPLILDAGEKQVGPLRVRLSPELGLEYLKKEGGTP